MKITIIIEHEKAENCLMHESDNFEDALQALTAFSQLTSAMAMIKERVMLYDQALPGTEETVIATFKDDKLVKEERQPANELLPCPFCAAPRPKLYQAGGYWKIRCLSCFVTINGSTNKGDLIASWNRRDAPDLLS